MDDKKRIIELLESILDETIEIKNNVNKIRNKLTSKLFHISQNYKIIGNDILKIKDVKNHKVNRAYIEDIRTDIKNNLNDGKLVLNFN
tara:strand:- start:433 stop:696 length:264 start_codon:yes stop_codon:yes gene_type:complete